LPTFVPLFQSFFVPSLHLCCIFLSPGVETNNFRNYSSISYAELFISS
jgi:hypothetical protein